MNNHFCLHSLAVSLSCGAVSDQNNTYFTSSLATTDNSPCTAKVATTTSSDNSDLFPSNTVQI